MLVASVTLNKVVVHHCRPAADVLKAGSDEETVGWINEHLARHGGTTSGLYVLTVSRETARRQACPCADNAVLALSLSRPGSDIIVGLTYLLVAPEFAACLSRSRVSCLCSSDSGFLHAVIICLRLNLVCISR